MSLGCETLRSAAGKMGWTGFRSKCPARSGSDGAAAVEGEAGRAARMRVKEKGESYRLQSRHRYRCLVLCSGSQMGLEAMRWRRSPGSVRGTGGDTGGGHPSTTGREKTSVCRTIRRCGVQERRDCGDEGGGWLTGREKAKCTERGPWR